MRRLSLLPSEGTARAAIASRSLIHATQTSSFSTSAARLGNPNQKKKTVIAAPKRGTKTLNVKKGRGEVQREGGKRPAQGERKALKKRVVLSNTNALEVPDLKDVNKDNILTGELEGKVMGIPDMALDSLRAVDAFKPTQGWHLFRRPASLIRKETRQLAEIIKKVEERKEGEPAVTERHVIVGERMSGKTTLLLQGLMMAFLRNWVVINLPDGMFISKENSVHSIY